MPLHIEEETIGRARIEQRQDVRMLQRCSGLDLLHEPLGVEHGGEFRLQQLERDLAIVLEIVAQRGIGALRPSGRVTQRFQLTSQRLPIRTISSHFC